MTYEKTCPVCKTVFYGRKNKKYCSTSCKSQANNERQEEKFANHIGLIRALKRNRRIIEAQLGEQSSCTILFQHLKDLGYDPSLCTSIEINNQNKYVLRCFEYGLILEGEQVTLLKLDIPCYDEAQVIDIDIDPEFLNELFSLT